MKKFLFGSILLVFTYLNLTGSSQYYFEYSALAKDAYHKALSLKFDSSKGLINQLKHQNPQNLIVHHIENYIDFLTVYISGEEAMFESFKQNKNNRLNLVKSGDEHSPYYLFVQASIRFQVGLVRLKYGEYLPAFQDISKAYKLLKKNQKLFPEFIPNYKDLGILHAIIGTIPSNYQWGLKLLTGLEGNIQQGKSELTKVLGYAKSQDFLFEEETHLLYSLLMLMIENSPEKSWKYLQSCNFNPSKNLMHCYVLANVAMQSGRNDKAIELLVNRPRGNQYLNFPNLDFMLGLAKARRLDQDAGLYLKAFLRNTSGSFYVKAAYQKLAWLELIAGRQTGYHKYIQATLKNGVSISGEDVIAQKEASETLPPNPILVKARLLFDGGYYQKAYAIIDSNKQTDFKTRKDQLEFYYRKGRILHGLDRYFEALNYYRLTIKEGEKEPYFFACNAALQIGLIYERQKKFPLASYYYKKCLSINPSEYKSSLHQKAKAGLERIQE